MDNMMVVFYKDDKRLCSFYCENYAEMLKLLHFAKKYETPLWIRDDDDSIPEEIRNEFWESCIEDYGFEFGSDKCIQILRVQLI